MKTSTLSLPEVHSDLPPLRGQRKALASALPFKPFPRVVPILRQGPALLPGPLPDQKDVWGLNLARGCVHRCAFCPARAYPNYPGEELVYFYAGTARQVDGELAEREEKPRAVYLCPATDPFQPVSEIQEETARVVAVLARHKVEAWLTTRGYIRPAVLETLAAHRETVRVTVSLTTLDRGLQRTLESLAASPRLRLRQIKKLRELGIPVQVALEPLLPGLTDTRANLGPLLEALAGVGVERITAGYLFLRPRLQENLVRVLEPAGWDGAVMEAFQGGPLLEGGSPGPARYLPKSRRQRGYAALMALAAERGMTVRVSALFNPDFRTISPARPDGARPLHPLLADQFRAAQPLEKVVG